MTSTGDAKCDAGSCMRLLQDPQFIASLTVTQVILSFLGPVTKLLQAKDCNLADADHVALAKDCIRDVRNDGCWEKVWNRIEQVASSVNFTMVKPRTANVQCHPANAAA